MASDAAVEGVSGAAGGIVALLATYPLMTISTMQATRGKAPEAVAAAPLSPSPKSGDGQPPVIRKTQRGTFADIVEAVKSVGVKGLYSGLQPAVLGTAVSQGVYFYLYSLLRDAAVTRKHYLAGTKAGAGSLRQEELPIGASLAVAAAAGCGNVLLTNPIWVVATRMQSNKDRQQDHTLVPPDKPPKTVGPLAIAQQIFEHDGITGFWKGVLPSLVMVCNPTVQYVLFEWLLARVRDARVKAGRKGAAVAPTGGQVFLIGALAKLGATVMTYPLLLVKSRLMSQSKIDSAEMQYSGTVDALVRIYKQDGLAGFYAGLRAKIVQSVLAAAILFYIREEVYGAVRAVLGVPQPLIKPPKAVQ